MFDPAFPIPARVRALPRDERGYPVPWFVAFLDGRFDFRVIDVGKRERAVRGRLCWVCGQPLGRAAVYVVGPMCTVNRTSAEPPCHRECAEFSARACPFLTLPNAQRREHNLPAGAHVDGAMITRNPGVVMLWETRRDVFPFADGRGGFLFRLPDPVGITYWREGRPATRDEVVESIETGVPALRELAAGDAASLAELDGRVAEVLQQVRQLGSAFLCEGGAP